MGTIELPSGSAAKLLAFAGQLDEAASGTTGLASSTREAMGSTPSWTGDAANAAKSLGNDLGDGVAAIPSPLQRITTAIRSYADSLSNAQEKVNTYNLYAADESVTVDDPGYMAAIQNAAQDAQSALDAWQTAGDQAASEVQAATAELQGVSRQAGRCVTICPACPQEWIRTSQRLGPTSQAGPGSRIFRPGSSGRGSSGIRRVIWDQGLPLTRPDCWGH